MPRPADYIVHPHRHELAEADAELDLLDAHLDTLHRLRFEETKAGLARQGLDVSSMTPPRPRRRWETRTGRQPTPEQTDAILMAARARDLERLARTRSTRLQPRTRTIEYPGPDGSTIIQVVQA